MLAFNNMKMDVIYRVDNSGFAWSLYKCAALSRAIYGPSANERPFELFVKKMGIYSRFRV